MLIGICGKMGTGKTLTQTILATFLHRRTGIPLYANYDLEDSERFTSLSELWDMDTAIICFDELWLTMDSRLWANNVLLTRWINQTRKKKLLIFYTTQHISQVEMRVRKATDVLIYCQRQAGQTMLNFIDYQYQTLGRRMPLLHPERFYSLYDTFEVLEPIKIGKDPTRSYGKGKGGRQSDAF